MLLGQWHISGRYGVLVFKESIGSISIELTSQREASPIAELLVIEVLKSKFICLVAIVIVALELLALPERKTPSAALAVLN